MFLSISPIACLCRLKARLLDRRVAGKVAEPAPALEAEDLKSR